MEAKLTKEEVLAKEVEALRKKRSKRIRKLRLKGWTWQQIGDKLKISRQRACEIFNRYYKGEDDKQDRLTIRAKNYRRLSDKLQELARKKGCMICDNHKGNFVWHHRNLRKKGEPTLSSLLYSGDIKKIKKELKKCDPFCWNHHTKLHQILINEKLMTYLREHYL